MKSMLWTAMLSMALLISGAHAQTPSAQKPMPTSTNPETKRVFDESQKMLGQVPTMLRLLPEEALPGAWEELKSVQMNPKTAIPGKFKELIGAAVAAQIPCAYCSYFHKQVAIQINGANDREIREAIALAALSRHWSTLLNGLNLDATEFKRDLDRLYAPTQQRQTGTGSSDGSVSGTSSSVSAGVSPSTPTGFIKTPEAVYQDVERTFGFVPQFFRRVPQSAVVGAWNEMKALEINENTAIPPRYKSLIGLAVASQIPCAYCIELDTRAAKKAGATEQEIQEAVTMAGIVRHWSTVLNGNQVDQTVFRREADEMIRFVKASVASKPVHPAAAKQ